MTDESAHLEAAVNGRVSLPASAVRLWYSIRWQNIAYAALASYFLLVVVTLVGTRFTYETWGVSDSLFLLNAGWAVAEGLRRTSTSRTHTEDSTLCFGRPVSLGGADRESARLYRSHCVRARCSCPHSCQLSADPFCRWGRYVFDRLRGVRHEIPVRKRSPRLGHRRPLDDVQSFRLGCGFAGASFTLVPPRGARRRRPGCAIAAFALVLTKLTFLALAVPAVASLVLARRYTDLALVAGLLVAFAGAFWLLGGYGPAGYLNEIEYLLRASNYVSREKLTFGNKAVYVLFYNSFDIAYLLILYAVLHLKVRQIGWAQATCLALLLLCSWFVMIATGSYGMPFVNGPVFAFCAALALLWALGAEAEGPTNRGRRPRHRVEYLQHREILRPLPPERTCRLHQGGHSGEAVAIRVRSDERIFRREDQRLRARFLRGSGTEDRCAVAAREIVRFSRHRPGPLALSVEGWTGLARKSRRRQESSGRFFLRSRLSFHGRDKSFGEISTVQQRTTSTRYLLLCRRTLTRSWCCERTSAIPYTDGTNSRCARISPSPSHLDFGICTNDALCKKAHRRIGSLRAAALAADIAG